MPRPRRPRFRRRQFHLSGASRAHPKTAHPLAPRRAHAGYPSAKTIVTRARTVCDPASTGTDVLAPGAAVPKA